MRIISGKYKSRKIYSPQIHRDGRISRIRPTSDRARETIFDILLNMVDFCEISCLDLFAGTGAFGFECISRGASHCTFIDLSRESALLIKKTSQDLNLDKNISVIKSDSIKFLKEDGNMYDLIFADPPYAYDKIEVLVQNVFDRNFGIFILECGNEMSFKYDVQRFELAERKVGGAYFNLYINKNLN